MKLGEIIAEIAYNTYESMVEVSFSESSATKVAELLRALPGVTTVAIAGGFEDNSDKEIYKVKLISQKPGSEAFIAFKNNALKKYTVIKGINVAGKNIVKL
jgi:hypothetical protein